MCLCLLFFPFLPNSSITYLILSVPFCPSAFIFKFFSTNYYRCKLLYVASSIFHILLTLYCFGGFFFSGKWWSFFILLAEEIWYPRMLRNILRIQRMWQYLCPFPTEIRGPSFWVKLTLHISFVYRYISQGKIGKLRRVEGGSEIE